MKRITARVLGLPGVNFGAISNATRVARPLIASSLALLLLIFVLLAESATVAFAALNLPEATGYVNDTANMLSSSTVSSLESQLQAYQQSSGNEVAVVTVNDLQGTTVEDFAVRLFEKWKIGKKDKDNGVLLLIAKKERKVRIEVGYGLEPELTDAESFKIISDTITPAFKQGDYDGGVTRGVDSIVSAISSGDQGDNQSGSPAGTSKPKSSSKGLGSLIFPALFILFGMFQWFVSVLGRTKSWWLGGVIGAVIGLLVMILSPIIGVIAMALLTPLGLLFDFLISRAYANSVNQSYSSAAKHKGHHVDDAIGSIPWWAGGFWGPGGFGGGSGDDSGGGFGDFGGFGGGDSGGGGASGDW
jgi:uncharacterized protein